MAAGSFLLGLSRGMGQAQQRNFQQMQFEERQRREDERMRQMDEDRALRRNQQKILNEERQFNGMLQALPILSDRKVPKQVRAMLLQKKVAPVLNGIMLTRPGQDKAILPTTIEDWTPSLDKVAKELDGIFKSKTMDKDDQITAAEIALKAAGGDPGLQRMIDKEKQTFRAGLMNSYNWVLQNYDPSQRNPQAAKMIAQINKYDPELGKDLAGKLNQKVDAAKRRAAADEKARLDRLSDIEAAKITAGATRESTKARSADAIRKDYRKDHSDFGKNMLKPFREMEDDDAALRRMLKRPDAAKSLGAVGGIRRWVSSVLSEMQASGAVTVPKKFLTDATLANRIRARMINLAFKRALIQNNGRITEPDYQKARESALSRSSNPDDILAVLDENIEASLRAVHQRYNYLIESETAELGDLGKPRRRALKLRKPREIQRSNIQTAAPTQPVLPPAPGQSVAPPTLPPASMFQDGVIGPDAGVTDFQRVPVTQDVNQGVQPIGETPTAAPAPQIPMQWDPETRSYVPANPESRNLATGERLPAPPQPPAEVPATQLGGTVQGFQRTPEDTLDMLTQKYRLPKPLSKYFQMTPEQLRALPPGEKRAVIQAHREYNSVLNRLDESAYARFVGGS